MALVSPACQDRREVLYFLGARTKPHPEDRAKHTAPRPAHQPAYSGAPQDWKCSGRFRACTEMVLACCPLRPVTRHPPMTARPCQRVSVSPRGWGGEQAQTCSQGLQSWAHGCYLTSECKCGSSKFPPIPAHRQDECPHPQNQHSA